MKRGAEVFGEREPPPQHTQTPENRGAIFRHRGYLRSVHPPPHPFDPPRFPPANLLSKIKKTQTCGRKRSVSILPFRADAQ